MLMVRNLSQTQDKCAETSSLRYSEICVGYSVMKSRPQIAVFSLIYRKIELQSVVIDPFKDIEVFTYMAHRNAACIGDNELCFKPVVDVVGRGSSGCIQSLQPNKLPQNDVTSSFYSGGAQFKSRLEQPSSLRILMIFVGDSVEIRV